MSNEFLVLGLYATILFVPLVPTILIYALFPKKSSVITTGKLAGFNVKAGGAFGAYVFVLLATATWLVPRMEARMDRNEDRLYRQRGDLWRLKADIILKKNDGGEIRSSDALNKLKVLSPATYRYDSYGATIVFEKVDGEYPNITIEIPGYGEQALTLRQWSSSTKLSVDDSKRVIRIKDPIILRELSSGGAARPALVQAHGEETVERPQQ